jgi:hypothetical protein
MTFDIDIELETDGRWIAEVVLAERLEHGETKPALLDVTFKAA